MAEETRTNIFETTVPHFLAPVMPFLEDPTVAEVMINAFDEIYIEKSGSLVKTDARFEDDDALWSAVNNILQYTGKRLTTEHPLVDARLPDGSRVHVVVPPLCQRSIVVTIRKFAKVDFDAQALVKLGSWTAQAMEYLQMCVLGEKNLLVGGGTSSGKTVLLNVLSDFIPSHQRIVVIEDSSELELHQDHVVVLEARGPDRWGRGQITIRDLFRSSLRLRPDRIIIGEVRGGEALEMIQAMTSGHAGSMSTLHANVALGALNRLETMALMSQVDLAASALRAQITSAIDVVVQVTRFSDGRRGLTQIAEVCELDKDGHYGVQDVFEYELGRDEQGQLADIGSLVWTGKKSLFSEEPKMRVLGKQRKLTREIFDGPQAAGPGA